MPTFVKSDGLRAEQRAFPDAGAIVCAATNAIAQTPTATRLTGTFAPMKNFIEVKRCAAASGRFAQIVDRATQPRLFGIADVDLIPRRPPFGGGRRRVPAHRRLFAWPADLAAPFFFIFIG